MEWSATVVRRYGSTLYIQSVVMLVTVGTVVTVDRNKHVCNNLQLFVSAIGIIQDSVGYGFVLCWPLFLFATKYCLKRQQLKIHFSPEDPKFNQAEGPKPSSGTSYYKSQMDINMDSWCIRGIQMISQHYSTHIYTSHHIFINNGILKFNSQVIPSSKGYISQYTPLGWTSFR